MKKTNVIAIGILLLALVQNLDAGCDCDALGTTIYNCPISNMNTLVTRILAADPVYQSNVRLRISECYIYWGGLYQCFTNTTIKSWLTQIENYEIDLPAKIAIGVSDLGDVVDAANTDPTDSVQLMMGDCVWPDC